MHRMAAAIVLLSFGAPLQAAELGLVRISQPVNGHIHPAICQSTKGTLVVTYGHINHRDLRLTRSTDGGATWSTPERFAHTVSKTYYPGSLTTLKDGRLLHCWNRWSAEDNETEPRSVLYSFSADDGLMWSEPQPIPSDGKSSSVIRHPIVELPSNEWVVPLWDRTVVWDPVKRIERPFGDGRKHGLTPVVRTSKGTFVSGTGHRSTDDGRTWQVIDKFPDIHTQGWRHEMVALSNGWLLASEILGPGFGGDRIRYVISRDDGLSWNDTYEYYNPGRPINGRACPRTIEIDNKHIGVVFYDIDAQQPGGPGLFFLKIPLASMAK
ncbi:MAG: exo-alpha-sialidase [Planctomycetes bacterium]|nr:exo-alpha-sialidase [Planctomycetota bacterium]